MTILHIDDDPDLRLLLRELAALAEGEPEIQVLEAAGLEEAVMRYGSLQPDTILLDNRLGRASGVELLARVREVWRCPVWILTGLPPEVLCERSRLAGAAGVVSKDELLRDATQLRTFLLRCRDPTTDETLASSC